MSNINGWSFWSFVIYNELSGRSVVVSANWSSDTVKQCRVMPGRSVVVSRKSGGLEVVGSIPAAPTKKIYFASVHNNGSGNAL